MSEPYPISMPGNPTAFEDADRATALRKGLVAVSYAVGDPAVARLLPEGPIKTVILQLQGMVAAEGKQA